MTIRFHLDESVSLRIVRALRDRVIDVTTPADVGLLSAIDEHHLSFAHSAGRVLVAHDDDYIRLHSQSTNHAGIAYCHQSKYSAAELLHSYSSSMRATTLRRWSAVWSTCSREGAGRCNSRVGSGKLQPLASRPELEAIPAPLSEREWVVHCEGPLAWYESGIAAMKYLAQCVRATAIGDRRASAGSGPCF